LDSNKLHSSKFVQQMAASLPIIRESFET
jgi:hypothetical protein